MARVTIEDCVDKVDSRFELVLLAGNRAREISAGAPVTVDRDNDKNPVVALREIADETVSVDDLRDAVVKGLQKWVEADEFEQNTRLWRRNLPGSRRTLPTFYCSYTNSSWHDVI